MSLNEIMKSIYTDAFKKEGKAAYRRLVKLHHPDLGGTEELFLLVQQAWEEFTN
jgi:molecular chaperone DnaJ